MNHSFVSFSYFIIFIQSELNKHHPITSARYPVTCTKTYILTVKPCDTPKYVCSFYRPSHHTKWLQLLAPSLNITNCDMYMSTALTVDTLCYVTQCYYYIPDVLYLKERQNYSYISELPNSSITSRPRPKTVSFYITKLYIKVCTSIFIILLLLLLMTTMLLTRNKATATAIAKIATHNSIFWHYHCLYYCSYYYYYLLTYLLHGAESFLRSYLVLQLVKKFPTFLEPEGFWLYSQVPATCPYPEPTPSSPHNPLPLPEDPS